MLPSRQTPRHALIDYSRGTFFVTICCMNRTHLFGRIAGGQMHNNGLGFLVQDEWFKIPGHYSNVSLDVFTTMPNHLHGILALHSLVKKSDKPEARSLSSVVGNFKSGVSRKARQLKLHDVGMIFQPRFYDHSIRHERALERVREYILNNPAKWSLDRENSLREGLDPFYEWIEAYSQHISPARTR